VWHRSCRTSRVSRRGGEEKTASRPVDRPLPSGADLALARHREVRLRFSRRITAEGRSDLVALQPRK
jgi:hypothetical protein